MGTNGTSGTTEGTPGPRPLTRRVFVSSTSVDLPRHRERVRDVLLRLGLFPVAMEYFGAQGSGDATSVSIGGVDTCDAYLGLVAWRYGHVPAGATRSVTEQEYDEAKRVGLPCYVFLADPSTEANDLLFPAAARNSERHAALEAFRARLERENLREYFTTPDDLATKVATALAGYVVRLREEALTRGPRPPREVPPRPPEFVGREAELVELEAALRRGQSVGLSAAVSGLAGVGKSALAAELTYRLVVRDPPPFPGGIAWVRCGGREGLQGLAWVLDQLLAAWGATLAPEELARAGDDEAAVELRARALRTRLLPSKSGHSPAPALVLLDNVEYRFPLDRGLEVLAPLGITLLTTSRHQPGAPGLQLLGLGVLDHDAAVRLFAERYAERGGAWEERRDVEAAGAVVEALGRLPLAIELAAARAARQQAGVGALQAELGEAGRLGKLSEPGDPRRGVRYILERSLALLDGAQRARFAALGLPDGADWPRPVIERLLAAVPPAEIGDAAATSRAASDDLDLLTALSLVTLVAPSPPEVPEPRVRLHPLLRELAQEEWGRRPQAAQRAGMAALLAGVRAMVEEHRGDFAALGREEQLIEGALRRAARDHVDPEVLATTVDALLDYLDRAGRRQLGIEMLGWRLEAHRALGDRRGEATTLDLMGNLGLQQGQAEAAAGYYEQALVILRETGDRAAEAAMFANLGSVALERGRRREAVGYYERALAMWRDLGHHGDDVSTARLALAITKIHVVMRGGVPIMSPLAALRLLWMMSAARRARRNEAARAVSIAREAGDRTGEAVALAERGRHATGWGAARYFERALALARESGDRAVEAAVLADLGVVATRRRILLQGAVGIGAINSGRSSDLGSLLGRDRSRWEEATRYFEQALAIFREMGDRVNEGVMLTILGAVARWGGRREEEARYYEQALAVYEALGIQHEAVDARKQLTALEHRRRRR
jgi:tetratricopeptide (TPR) repeat protein